MQINTNIHMRAGDEVSFRCASTTPTTACWIEFGAAGLFGELPELLQLRGAMDEMIAFKQQIAAKKAA